MGQFVTIDGSKVWVGTKQELSAAQLPPNTQVALTDALSDLEDTSIRGITEQVKKDSRSYTRTVPGCGEYDFDPNVSRSAIDVVNSGSDVSITSISQLSMTSYVTDATFTWTQDLVSFTANISDIIHITPASAVSVTSTAGADIIFRANLDSQLDVYIASIFTRVTGGYILSSGSIMSRATGGSFFSFTDDMPNMTIGDPSSCSVVYLRRTIGLVNVRSFIEYTLRQGTSGTLSFATYNIHSRWYIHALLNPALITNGDKFISEIISGDADWCRYGDLTPPED